jgi:hypothetical protein
MSEFVEVTREDYPNKVEKDTKMFYEPPLTVYYDFSKGDKADDTTMIAHHSYAYAPGSNEKPVAARFNVIKC